MVGAPRFDVLSTGLADGVRADDRFVGLALLGSGSTEAAFRRDEWSDHDFFAIARPGHGAALRSSYPDFVWMPARDGIVLVAREGEIGFVALYEDGHVMEFALAEPGELGSALADDATVVIDDAGGTTAQVVRQSRERAAADSLDPTNDARLVLVKLLIGVGRLRRGERLNGGQFVRTWAVTHLVRAIRGRFPDRSSGLRDAADPMRRFEDDFPEWSELIATSLDRPAEEAARAVFGIARDLLEPGWPEFPTRAADAVAARLGWPRRPLAHREAADGSPRLER